jgi:hypothetical protein
MRCTGSPQGVPRSGVSTRSVRKRVRRMRRTGDPRGLPRIDGEHAKRAQKETYTALPVRVSSASVHASRLSHAGRFTL